MMTQHLHERARKENVLISVMLELTYQCNLDCFFCYNDRNLKGVPLSKGQYLELLDELHDMQVLHLTLSGGEPLAHPDFFELGARARKLGFVVRIKSNGHALNSRLAWRVKNEIDPFIIDISLHGATAATHDRQTRVPGSFDKLISNLAVLAEFGLRYKLNTTITRWNENEIQAMFAMADDLGVPLQTNAAVTPRDDGDLTPLEIAPSSEAIGDMFATMLARNGFENESLLAAETAEAEGCAHQKRENKLCGTGSTTLTIDPVGNILPCVQWRRPVGNVHRDSIKALWHRSPDLADVRSTAARAGQYVANLGRRGQLMSYCIGEAVNHTGSPVGAYPAAQRRMDSRLSVLIKE